MSNLWNKFRVWIIGVAVAIFLFYRGIAYIEDKAEDELIAEQNKKALDRIQERKVIENEVDNLDVDATVDRLRTNGWLRNDK